ncbi:hypothetical protein LTS18_012186, partial [Coniosporium uncinatum]
MARTKQTARKTVGQRPLARRPISTPITAPKKSVTPRQIAARSSTAPSATTASTSGEPLELPQVPVKHSEFVSYIASKPDISVSRLLQPYKEFDARLRRVFAQHPNHTALEDQHVNVVPIFDGNEGKIKIRARDLATEPDAEKEKYIMPLADADRKANGAQAVVQSLKQFQNNFN